MTLKNLPTKAASTVAPRKQIIWNTRKRDGWKRYKEKTEKNAKLEKIANSDEANHDTVFKAIEKELNNTKHISFGRIKVYAKPKGKS